MSDARAAAAYASMPAHALPQPLSPLTSVVATRKACAGPTAAPWSYWAAYSAHGRCCPPGCSPADPAAGVHRTDVSIRTDKKDKVHVDLDTHEKGRPARGANAGGG